MPGSDGSCEIKAINIYRENAIKKKLRKFLSINYMFNQSKMFIFNYNHHHVR